MLKTAVKHLAGQHNQKAHGVRHGSFDKVKASLRKLQDSPEELARYKKKVRKNIKKAKATPEAERNYRRFENNAEIAKVLGNKKELDEHCEKVPDECKEVLDYTKTSYIYMNRALRDKDGEGWKAITSKYEGGYKEKIEALDKALANLPKVKEDILVYRSAGNTGRRLIEQLQVGDTFEDKGFVSTSANKWLADNFGFGGNDGIFEIRVKKGQTAAYINSLSDYDNEHEVLLPRNSKFKVISKQGRTAVVELME